MQPIEQYNRRASSLFDKILKGSKINADAKISIIIVTHILPDKPAMISALRKHFHIAGVIPKPKSIDYGTLAKIRDSMNVPLLMYSRDNLREDRVKNDILNSIPQDNKLILFDVGGYFVDLSKFLQSHLNDRFIGVVEDTENGHQKYTANVLTSTVISVARSPLKEPEDFLVGQSIVFSADAVIRQNNDLLINKDILVLGYGKIGKSIASSISSRNIKVSVFDKDPIKMAQARSHGYNVGKRIDLLKNSDVIFGATGNKSLCAADLRDVRNACFIISVTSRDDEFDELEKTSEFNQYPTEDNIIIYESKNRKKKLYMVNGGNAANFLHNAVVGPYIYLVQSELILAACRLFDIKARKGLHELTADDRRFLAEQWLEHF